MKDRPLTTVAQSGLNQSPKLGVEGNELSIKTNHNQEQACSLPMSFRFFTLCGAQQLFRLMGRAPVPYTLDWNESNAMSGWQSQNTRKKRSQTVALERNTLKLVHSLKGEGTGRTYASTEHGKRLA